MGVKCPCSRLRSGFLYRQTPGLDVQCLPESPSIFREGRNDHGRQSYYSGQMACWNLVNRKCQERHQLLRSAPGNRAVTQKTAWFMLQRIRLAMQTGSIEKMKGEVEVDETFIGGKARNMHADRNTPCRGTGGVGKAIVVGLLERWRSRSAR